MSKTFCPLPWASVAVRNDGCYRVCCHANVSDQRGLLTGASGEVLNAKNNRISEARNSKELKEVRAQMLKGEWPQTCSRCQREESAGLRSKRTYALERIKLDMNATLKTTGADGVIDIVEQPLRDLDLRFGNKCNLKCRMCGPSDSSSWYGDYEKIHGRSYQHQHGLDWYDSQIFWDDLQHKASLVEHIYVVGGEPLLIEKHYEFLEHLISEGRAEAVVLEYNTNLSVLPERVLNLWGKFKEVRIGVSIDAWGPLNNYIRHPSQFSILERNLERLDQTESNIVVWLACTVSIINLYDLSELMLWKVRKKFRKINGSKKKPLLTPHVLHKPENLSIQSLPREVKEHILRMIPEMREKFIRGLSQEEIPPEAQSYLTDKWSEIYEGITNHMMARDLSVLFPEFLNYSRGLDRIRGEQLEKVISPQYYHMLMEAEGGS